MSPSTGIGTVKMIEPELLATFKPELRPGERLIWAAKPSEAPLNLAALLGTVVATVFVFIGAIAFFMTALTGHLGAAAFVVLWTSIAAFNLYVASGHWLAPSSQVYALTNERGLIVERFRGFDQLSSTPSEGRAWKR